MAKAEVSHSSQRTPTGSRAKRATGSSTKPIAKNAVQPKQADGTGGSAKPKKIKLVRDSFTMPEPEYALISAMKKRCLGKGVAVKKSELLRAAVTGLAAKSDTALLAALKALPAIKTGRPPKGKK